MRVQHIEREGEEGSDKKAQEAVNQSLPDLLFAAALAQKKIIQFDPYQV